LKQGKIGATKESVSTGTVSDGAVVAGGRQFLPALSLPFASWSNNHGVGAY
jgi:hypothetical protein